MQIGNKIFDTEHHTAVMAILNVTPVLFRMAAATKIWMISDVVSAR